MSRASGGARVRERALILRRFTYGETSLVVHALTCGQGKVHLLAKGAYRPRSRLGGVLDLFDTLELGWTPRPGQELQALEEADIVERRHRIAHSLPRFRAALSMLELAGLAAPERSACHELFELCSAGLDALRDGADDLRALVEFELAFLHNLGLAPALEACAACGAPAPVSSEPGAASRSEFSAASGGRLCAACAVRARETGARVGTLPLDVLDFAAALRRGRAPHAVPAELLERTHDFLARFLRHQLEIEPKSFRVFLSAPHRNRREATAPGAGGAA